MNKKAQIINKLNPGIFFVVSVIILFSVATVLIPEAQLSGDSFSTNSCTDAGCEFDFNNDICEINSSTEGEGIVCPNPVQRIPLASIFDSNGVVIILIMLFLLFIVLSLVRNRSSK